MNLLVIGIGREKDLIIGYRYRLTFLYRAFLAKTKQKTPKEARIHDVIQSA